MISSCGDATFPLSMRGTTDKQLKINHIKQLKMEVILKKTKITTSILKQALRSTEVDLNVGEVLGWCLFGKAKYIVCYRSDVKGLSIFPMFKEIKVEQKYKDSSENKTFLVEVNLGGNYVPLKYTCSNESDKTRFIEALNKAKHNAETRGQFFI